MRRLAATTGLMAATLAGCIPSVDAPGTATPPPPSYEARPDQPPRASPPPRWRRPLDEQRPPPREQGRPRADADVSMPATARPAWEARPVAPDARAVSAGSYVVQPGDSLGRIADRTGAAAEAIARANGLPAPYTVKLGQRLTIPAGRYHLVRQGESGIAIARAYGVEWSRIVAANQLAEPYVLRAGQRVLIPGDNAAAPSRAERAAAFTLDIDDIITGGEPAPAPRQAPARRVTTPRRVLPPTAVVAAPARLPGGAFLWPVDGEVVRRFGPGRSGERNDGIKIAIAAGSPIHATQDGVVAYAGTGIAALGGLIIIKHGGGWTSVYGHASKLLVQRGQSVKRGQTIGLSGDTGSADRPEVHFELRRGRTPVDPQTVLARR
ncbi:MULTISPECIES: M23 family metallopeptidase [unclassified Sphingomonas]|uniref:M23 family metallopeptidase n=1 Tax=unclassified Sphingomonas TaxID=196159 RepID=UPI00226AD0BA|nr:MULTISPECIES: M23 family metallopeptidase [unclassified Sphingomonas]